MLAKLFGLVSLLKLMAALGEIPGYLALAGLVLIALDLWQSEKSQDEKIWWTALGVIFAPITIPAYWVSCGWKRNIHPAKAKESPASNG